MDAKYCQRGLVGVGASVEAVFFPSFHVLRCFAIEKHNVEDMSIKKGDTELISCIV